ncbi:MAG TPA: hypothetical protein VNO81_08250, partial [Candidatus Nitrosotenuis sp.]|nr:hypothetical protein [Candidatus Nitrosotenuis sp.]
MRRAALLLLFLAALLGAPARARPNPETSPQAQELLSLLLEGNYIQARQKAQDWLRRDPRHPVPLFAMGVVLYEAEGNLPRAYHCLSQARRLLREGWGEPVQGPVYLHQQVLQYLIRVTAEADRYQEQIQLLDDWERFDYYPKMTASYGWPLMKLGRLEEARGKMRQAMEDSLLWAEAANTLAAIEFETGNYGQSLGWMRQLHQRYGADATTCCNVGEVMLSVGMYAPAEREFLEGSRHFRRLTYSNPWEYLVDLYTAQNRLPEALSAVRRMNALSQSRAPQLIQQDWAELQAAQALALLAAGVDERALKVMARVLDRPDRRGGISVQAHQAEAGHLMLYYVLLGQHRQRLAEEMSWSDWGRWLRLGWQRRQAARQRFEARSRAAALLVSHGEAALSLRPHGPRRVLSEWLLPTFNEVLGPGVTAAEVRRLLSRDDEQGRRERPFLLAVLGEGLWQRGRAEEAREALQEARAGLPAEEV